MPLPLFYTADTLAARDTVLFSPMLGAEHYGMSAQLRTAMPADNDTVAAISLTVAALLAIAVYHSRSVLADHVAALFLPSSRTKAAEGPHALNGFTLTVFALTFAASTAILFHQYAATTPPDRHMLASWLADTPMLGLYTMAALAYLLLRLTLTSMVHAVFMTTAHSRLARQNLATCLVIEATLLYIAALAGTHLCLPGHALLWAAGTCFLLGKMAATWRISPYLFAQKHGLVHFFTYFCTLEAAPLSLLWSTLVFMTSYLAAL